MDKFEKENVKTSIQHNVLWKTGTDPAWHDVNVSDSLKKSPLTQFIMIMIIIMVVLGLLFTH